MATFNVRVSSRNQASEECREALQCGVLDIAGQNGAQFELAVEVASPAEHPAPRDDEGVSRSALLPLGS